MHQIACEKDFFFYVFLNIILIIFYHVHVLQQKYFSEKLSVAFVSYITELRVIYNHFESKCYFSLNMLHFYALFMWN